MSDIDAQLAERERIRTRVFSFYDAVTGEISRRRISCPGEMIARNTPEGMKAIQGELDHLSQRVDVATGQVIDYQPPQPSADHEWDEASKRWNLTAEAAARHLENSRARGEIATLEAQQHRYVAESVLGTIDDEGKRRLAAIRTRIVELRKVLL